MSVSRRIFIRDGVATVTLGLAAPSFLSAIAHAQGLPIAAPRRRLSGRRQRLAQHARRVSRRGLLQPASVDCGAGRAGAAGRHRRLRSDDRSAPAAGRSAEHLQRGASGSRATYWLPELEPIPLRGQSDIWGTANPQMSTGSGWLGRYLDTLPRPLDALAAWNTTGDTPRALLSATTGVPAIPNSSTYTYASPNRGAAALQERAAAQTMANNPASSRPNLAYLNGTSRGAIETLDRVAAGGAVYADGRVSEQRVCPIVAHRRGRDRERHRLTRVLGLRPVVTTRTRARAEEALGSYGNLMGTLGDGLAAFYTDIRNQGLAPDTTIIVFSEFSRRISENGSAGTDHGAAGLMMVLGGSVRGGLYGTAPQLSPGHPTLENNSGDVRYETDFRSVYARVLDQWLGVNSVAILNGDFRAGAPAVF